MSGIDDWRGRVGREWAARADAMEGLLGPIGIPAMDALGEMSGLRVLDLGCGAGDTSRALTARGAMVTGIDVSEDLIALARASDPENRVTWRLEDAAVATFDTAFDALYSRCGAMFFDDPVRAFIHLRNAMVPGAKLAIATWRGAEENGWARIPLEAAAPVLGEAETRLPPPGGAGPFGWADPAPAIDDLRRAGWSDVRAEKVDAVSRIGTGTSSDPIARAVEFTLRIGVLASRLRGRDEATRQAVGRALEQRFADHVVDGAVTLPAAGWVFHARA